MQENRRSGTFHLQRCGLLERACCAAAVEGAAAVEAGLTDAAGLAASAGADAMVAVHSVQGLMRQSLLSWQGAALILPAPPLPAVPLPAS